MRVSTAAAVEHFYQCALLGLLASGYLAVAGSGYLDPITLTVSGAGLVLRALLVLKVIRFDISPRMVNAATLLYCGFYPLDYSFLSRDFITATVHLILFLAVVKVLTAKTERDYSYIKVIAFLEILAASVLSANINFFLFLALFLMFGVATFASAEIRGSLKRHAARARPATPGLSRRLLALSASLLIGILLMTAGLFFLLPRTARAAFQHLSARRLTLPGFSNEVTLGQIGEIQQQSAIAMRIRIDTVRQPPALKWRGAALASFDGRRWYNPPGDREVLAVEAGLLRLVDLTRPRPGSRIMYEVLMPGLSGETLFLAGTPEFISIRSPQLVRSSHGSYRLGYGPVEDLRYSAQSFLQPDPKAVLPPAGPLPPGLLQSCLQLPPLDPRIPELARAVTAGARTDADRAHALEQYLRTRYTYTLDLLETEVPDPLSHFLFTRRKGHCEYFASSMAILLRTLQIPSRVATGFQSGEYNPISGWHVVRTSDAHSWVEAYLEGIGWTTFDPTPPNPDPVAFSLFRHARLYLEAAEMFWQEWVLDYDLERQWQLAVKVDSSRRNWRWPWLDRVARQTFDGQRTIAWLKRWGWLPVLAGAVLAAAIFRRRQLRAWMVERQRAERLQRGAGHPADATILYQRMIELLRQRGIEKPVWLTPTEFVQALPASPVLPLLQDFTTCYLDMRFGGKPQAAPRLLALLTDLERQPSGVS